VSAKAIQRSEVSRESAIQHPTDMRKLQDHPPQGRGAGYLHQPQAQAAAGMIAGRE
jgi:hypothetical protein